MNGDLDWQGALVVYAILLGILAFGYREEARAKYTHRANRGHRRTTYADRVVTAALVAGIIPDHADCENDDCDNVICACPEGLCWDCVEQGCTHHNLLCGDCRLDCTDCLDDARHEWVDHR